MMGRQNVDQSQLFYLFNLGERIPTHHLLRRINPVVTRVMAELRENLALFYSEIGRPSIDPELMIRMLIVGYCYGIRSERRLCQEVELHLAYRWFCRLDLDDKVPDHSTFSVNRHGRFRESDAFRHVFEATVRTCMDRGLVKGEGFAVDASVMEADASRYHGVAPEEADWSAPERQTRAVAEFLGALDDDDPTADRKPPKVISLSDACTLKPQCCPRMPFRKVTRDLNEDARDVARALMHTPEFDKSRDERKKVEMRFAHLKTHHRFERMRLRGLSGARDEFHLAAIVQNLKTLAIRIWRPPPNVPTACVA